MRSSLIGAAALALAACGSSSQPCVATILPTNTTVSTGENITFTSSLDGRPQGQTLWSATGGFIDAVGNYVAPDQPGDFTVTVRDAGDAKCTATARVHVVLSDAGTPDAGP